VDILRQLLDPSGPPQRAKSHPFKTSLYFFICTMPYHRSLNFTCSIQSLLTHMERLYTPAYTLLQLLCTYSPLYIKHWWSHHSCVYWRW